jgi:transposase-like protein
VYRAVDQHGQIIDVPLSVHRDAGARAPVLHPGATYAEGDAKNEVVTDAAAGILDAASSR